MSDPDSRRELTRHRDASSSNRGSTLVEFALVIIILCMLLFGIIDFGRALYTYHFVANAAREATRYASVRGKSCVGLPNGCPAQEPDIVTYIAGITPAGINPGDVTLEYSQGDLSIWPGTGPGSSGNGGCTTTTTPYNNPGCIVRVKLSYPFNFIFPFMPTGQCSVGQGKNGNICFQSSSEMVISQ